MDSKTKIIYTAVATAANVADSAVLPDLLHGEETRVGSDQALPGKGAVMHLGVIIAIGGSSHNL